MHIPDGYLSPATCAVMYASAAPFWYVASRKLKTALTSRMVPLLAIFSALSFVIMMLNIPLPGGTTGHAVGGVIIAIFLGPWAAVLGVSMALIIQSVFFGDGGITAIGANVFNMAVVLPLVGYFVYRLIAGGSQASSSRRVIGAAIGGYVGINAGALLTAIELGVQPLLFKAADGTPLYAPYGLQVAIPAMMIGHLLTAGLAEAFVTALVVSYVQRTNLSLLESERKVHRGLKPLWVGLGILVLISPLGLLASGTAWGEWAISELEGMGLGFVPQGMQQLTSLWSSPMSGYGVSGLGSNLGYMLSALFGILLIIGVVWGFSKLLLRIRSDSNQPGDAAGKRRHHGFLRKTITGLSAAVEANLFAEDTARAPGFLQSLDPRIKVVTFLAFIVTIALSSSVLALVALYIVALVLAISSRVSLSFFVKRVWVFMPFFTGIVALPALFNVITPGQPLLVLADWGQSAHLGPFLLPSQLAITYQGAHTASLLVLRVAGSVSFAVLLILTTRWASLLKALRVLGVPRAFIAILGMTYRYIFLFLHTANSMFLARESRTAGRLSADENRRWVGQMIGSLFAKSYQLSNDVYLAMISRGYRGEIMVMDTFQTKRRDWLWVLSALVMVVIAIGYQHVI